jgi:thiamine-phosphate pyrophosphorylase
VSRRDNPALDFPRQALRKPIVCYVTDRRSLRFAPPTDLFEPVLEKIALAASAGVDWIQLREKDLSGRDAALLAHRAIRCVLTRADQTLAATRILVNDRLDVALAEQAGGVHLRGDSLPVEEAKSLFRAYQATRNVSTDFLVGVSCHSLEAAQLAASAGADYVFFGPVFATPSKAPFGSPQGLARLSEVCHSLSVPVLAIGGITLANAPSCFSAGASGIAAIRLFQDAPDLAAVVRDLHNQRL